VIDQRQVEIDQRKAGFNLRGRFVMESRKRQLTSVVVKIPQVVVGLDVSWFVLQREGEVI
jgi:hypothetical protein